MKIFHFIIISTFFVLFPISYSNAECVTKSESNETVIECETTETTTYNVASFSENKATTSFIPMYTNKNVYIIAKVTGININVENHVLNIGNSQSVIDPRIDLEITTLNNKVGNETINIYGMDSDLNPSSLYITNLKNDYGNLTINGEAKNNTTIENTTILEDLFLDKINANITNLSVNDIYLSSSALNLNNNGAVDINDINSDKNSNITISSNGNIDTINSMADIIFSGENTIIHIGSITSSKDILLKNNMEVIVDEILKNNKILFLGAGKLTSNELNLKEIIIEGDTVDTELKNSMEIINRITSENMYIKNIQLDLRANGINIKDSLFLENSILNIESNLTADKMYVEKSFVSSTNNLVISDLLLNNSLVRFNNIQIGGSLYINNSLLTVDRINFTSFKENPLLTIDVANNIMFYQGGLKSGIYSDGDVTISNNVDLNLLLMGSNRIKQGESFIFEIIYSKNGEINYNPNNLFLNGETGILDINYYLVQEEGTSFVAEITRTISYCEALKKSGVDCDDSNKLTYTEEDFIEDTAKILDSIIKEGIPITDNLSGLIGGLDQSSLEELESNIASLKPVSNDVILFENHNNSKLIKDMYISNNDKDKNYNFSIFSLKGKIEDNILKGLSETGLLGIYYGASFDNDLRVGVALSKSKIDSSLYKIDNIGMLLLSSYDFKFNDINLDFMGSFGINKYDRNKRNFNNSITESSSMLNNIAFRTTAYKDYVIKDIKVSPKFYYDVSYLVLSGYKERGNGYLYEASSSSSLISEASGGIEVSNKIANDKALLLVGFNMFYLSYSSNNSQVRAYETTPEYIQFGSDIYSTFGLSASLGINYTFNNNKDINFSYKGSFYDNNSFFNGLVLSLKV